MRILVLWCQRQLETRKTIIDHTFCFQRYDKKNEYFFFNVYNGRFEEDYSWITDEMFDAVIFQCTALGLRWWEQYWDNFLELMGKVWHDYPCIKILMPQDDYDFTNRIWAFAKAVNASKIYTIIRKEDYPVIYPINQIQNIELETVFTGYVEKNGTDELNLLPHVMRPFDVVYRANKLSFHYGDQGQLKSRIADVFKEKLKDSSLVIDIEKTFEGKHVIWGKDWIHFISLSRNTIGCLSGSGLADITGELSHKVKNYVLVNQQASYETVKENCFPNIKENLQGVLSPRVFECALTKTCQILVGKDYQGVLEPDIDYIVLENNFSNIDDVIEKISDVGYCEKIAEKCYEDIILSGKYDYSQFVHKIVDYINRIASEKGYSEELSNIIYQNCEINNKKVWAELIRKNAGRSGSQGCKNG